MKNYYHSILYWELCRGFVSKLRITWRLYVYKYFFKSTGTVLNGWSRWKLWKNEAFLCKWGFRQTSIFRPLDIRLPTQIRFHVTIRWESQPEELDQSDSSRYFCTPLVQVKICALLPCCQRAISQSGKKIALEENVGETVGLWQHRRLSET
jgi:hypothetical protein